MVTLLTAIDFDIMPSTCSPNSSVVSNNHNTGYRYGYDFEEAGFGTFSPLAIASSLPHLPLMLTNVTLDDRSARIIYSGGTWYLVNTSNEHIYNGTMHLQAICPTAITFQFPGDLVCCIYIPPYQPLFRYTSSGLWCYWESKQRSPTGVTISNRHGRLDDFHANPRGSRSGQCTYVSLPRDDRGAAYSHGQHHDF